MIWESWLTLSVLTGDENAAFEKNLIAIGLCGRKERIKTPKDLHEISF